MQELFNKYGSTDQIMQEHHWIKQEYIKSGNYPFLTDKWLTDPENLSTIVGHVGSHKAEYNKMVKDYLDDLLVYWKMNPNCMETINEKILEIIENIKNSIPQGVTNNKMNNSKLYFLN